MGRTVHAGRHVLNLGTDYRDTHVRSLFYPRTRYGPKPHEYFAHERRSNDSNHTGREYNNFVEIFDRCDEVDRENAALMPRQPGGCMAYSHRYREELTKVLQVEGDRPTSNSFVPKWLRTVFG